MNGDYERLRLGFLHLAVAATGRSVLAAARRFCLLAAAMLSAAALAQETEFAPVPEPPELPPAVQSGQPLEPEITIVRRKDADVAEYRINGLLYMIEVRPASGPSYYLLDDDGDGHMDTRIDTIADVKVPQWVLFSW